MTARAENPTGIAGLSITSDELNNDAWNIFAKPSLITSIDRDKDIEIPPISAVTDGKCANKYQSSGK